MAHKATHQHADSRSTQVPVVLFGVDQNGKPKAARFVEKHADLATKAAAHLKLHVLPIVGPAVADLAGRLPAGRIHANGRGFVPYIRRDLYAKLIAAAGTTQAGAAGGSATSPSQQNGGLPKNWDDIGSGHVVIAQQSPDDGWFEAVVVETSGDMLTLRWRDYPRERRITRNRLAVGLLYPDGDPPAPDHAVKSRRSEAQPHAPTGTAYPKSWGDIAVGCAVLAKDDGPWCSWWEAIATEHSGDTFFLQWRRVSDMPQIAQPNIARHRLSLGLLYPNKH
jgi:hypothetical protein